MTVREERFDVAFPRHKPQFFAGRASDLAIASRYYAFGRSRHPLMLMGLEWVVRTPGLRRLFIADQTFELPHAQETWITFRNEIQRAVPVASVVLYQSQWRTERYAAMAISPTRDVVGFAQIRPDAMNYRLPERGAWSFRVPELLSELAIDGWVMRVFEPLPPHHTAAPWDADRITGVNADASTALEDVLEGDPPQGWVAAHGDLTPWNLRMDQEGQLWLIDWEQAMWAPRAADILRYLVTYGSLEGDTPSALYDRVVSELGTGPEVTEAASFWLDHEFYADSARELDAHEVTSGEIAASDGLQTQILVLQRLARRRHHVG